VEGRRYYLRSALVGVLFGCAETLKPQALIGLPPVLLYLMLQPRLFPGAGPRRQESVVVMGGLALAGFLLPLGAVALWLGHSGALPAFLRMVTHDWPLYAQLNVAPRQVPLAQPAHTWWVLRNLALMSGLFMLVAWAALGAWVGIVSARLAPASQASRARRYSVWLLVALAGAYWLYPATSQFWLYHWIPCLFFLLGLGALCLARLPEEVPRLARVIPVLVLGLVVGFTWLPPAGWVTGLRGQPIRPESADRTDAMTAYLHAHLRPGDTVQALDWTGGAIEAMLHARARPATRLLCDCALAHHVHSPYMRALRAAFMQQLARSRPRFVLEVLGAAKPMVSGPDVSYDFPELRAFLAANYEIAVRGKDYVIYSLK
jgi:hypothetical protein